MANNRKQVMPLPGEVLGLTAEPCQVTCPSCGITADSIVEKEITSFGHKVSMWCWCIFGGCCRNNKECRNLSQVGDLNHYCCKCGCYFGRYHPKDKAESMMCHVYT